MQEPSSTAEARQFVVLAMNGEKFVFKYSAGGEAALISQLMDLAERDDCPLTWVEVLLTVRKLGL